MSNLANELMTIDMTDKLDELTLERTHLKWFNALFTSIKDDLSNSRGYQAQTLAEIGQYLTEDLGGYKDMELDQLKQRKH